jgi:hypothetical protein
MTIGVAKLQEADAPSENKESLKKLLETKLKSSSSWIAQELMLTNLLPHLL